MNRNGWGIASAIYNWIAGVLKICFGLFLIVINGFMLDATRSVRDFFDVLPAVAALPNVAMIIIGIIFLLVGISTCVIGYMLMAGHNWARITSAVLHFVGALLWLGWVVMLIIGKLYGVSIVPVLLLLANIVLGVGLLLPSTANAYKGFGGMGSGGQRQTQIAPQMFPAAGYGAPPMAPTGVGPGLPSGFPAPMPQPAAPVAAPPSPGPAPQPMRGVARTEVAGPTGPQAMAWLVERNGPRSGREHRLDNQITLGRDPGRCEIVLDDSKISGEHARIRFEQGQFILFDLASTNHTYVNNQEVQKHVLRDGDQIRLGPNVQLTFVKAGKP